MLSTKQAKLAITILLLCLAAAFSFFFATEIVAESEFVKESVESVENVLRRYETGRCYRWAIALKDDDSIIGIIELLRFDETEGSCSFAYMIGDAFWGKGYGTQALKAALQFAFSEMEVAFVEVDHMAVNPASGAVMRKAGMTYVRTDEGKYQKNGCIYDAIVYRITRQKWMK